MGNKKFERPKLLKGITEKVETNYGNMYIVINDAEDKRPVEVFAVIGKSGKEITAFTESLGRLVSLLFQNGVGVSEVVKQLEGIEGEALIIQKDGKELFLSIPDAIAKVISKYYAIVDKEEKPYIKSGIDTRN